MDEIKESDTSRYLGLSMLVSIFLFILFTALFLAPFTTTVSSAVNDTFEANVTVGNAAPTISAVWFNDTEPTDPNITLQAELNTNLVTCNASFTDSNGYQDVSLANATFYHTVASTLSGADNHISHYTNTSCTITGSGTAGTVVCNTTFEHEAMNGTWNCTIFVKDGGSSTANLSASNSVEQLVALTINETAIHFGYMNNGESSSVANTTNVSNQGNVKIDIQVAGNADMTCSAQGAIGIGNISYNTTGGAYSTMSDNKLTTSLSSTLTAFNLVAEGASPFVADQAASNLTYWTINIPAGVRGECNNTITISAIMSSD